MKKRTIKKTPAVLVWVLCLAVALMLAGCTDEGQAADIYVTKADMPKVTYVEGQELDFSKGRLTVVEKGQEIKLPLTDSSITISGYDKNEIGEQTVTIQYGQLSTSVTVTVKARMVAENFETNYFVGDVFNKSVGKLLITQDNLEQITVNMSDEKVSIDSCDFSKAGNSVVTVSYRDGANTYSCQFSVNVYDTSKVEFTAPYKTQYNSYDAGVDTNGGYLTVTSADSKLTKQVLLSADMISGFDLSAATMENREVPLKQTVTVTYLGEQFQYDITISFGGASVVNYYAQNVLTKIDWADAKENGLPEDISLAAIDAVREFNNITSKQLELVTEEARNSVVRAGAVAVVRAFYNELEKYSKSLVMDAIGNLYVTCSSYEQTKADIEELLDPQSDINVYVGLLRWLEEEYGDTLLDEDMVISNLIIVYTEESETATLEALMHLTRVHELMETVPVEWDAETLKDYGDTLRQVAMEIYNAGYYAKGMTAIYSDALSSWREKDDVFEILYTYFLYDYENGLEFMANYMLGHMPLPGLVEEWYRSLYNAVSYTDYFNANGSESAFLADVSPYMYHYYRTQELSEQIKASENQLWVDVYQAYNGDYMMYYYLRIYTGGYLHIVKGMEDSVALTNLWQEYYEVMKQVQSGSLSAEEDEEALMEMFAAFGKLNPSELMGFLSSLNYHYSSSRGNLPTLSYDADIAYNMFVGILRDYYLNYLNEANLQLFADLLQAMENLALVGYKDDAMYLFEVIMQQLEADYNALSAEDRSNFDKYAGVAYQNYLNYYYLADGVVLAKQEQAAFAELEQILQLYFDTYVRISTALQNGQTVTADIYAVLFSLHARATELYDAIWENGSMDVRNALFLNNYEFLGDQYPLAQAYHMANELCVTAMEGNYVALSDGSGATMNIPLWDIYTKYELQGVMASIALPVYNAYLTENPTMEREDLLSYMCLLRDMAPLKRQLFYAVGAEDAYYKSVYQYLKTALSQTAIDSNIVNDLLNMDRNYFIYSITPENTEAYEVFVTLLEGFEEKYAALTEDEKAYLESSYNYFLAIYEDIKNAEPEAA